MEVEGELDGAGAEGVDAALDVAVEVEGLDIWHALPIIAWRLGEWRANSNATVAAAEDEGRASLEYDLLRLDADQRAAGGTLLDPQASSPMFHEGGVFRPLPGNVTEVNVDLDGDRIRDAVERFGYLHDDGEG